MAKRGTKSSSSSGKSPPDGGDPSDRILDAVLLLAARHGWSAATLAALAAETGISLGDIHRQFPSRGALIAGLQARADATAIQSPADMDEAPRERLFEILMRRFDALKPQRAGLRAVSRGLAGDPVLAICAASGMARSMGLMLEAAGISSLGLRGRLAVKTLTLLYLTVLRVFLDDTAEDLARTMATLDRRLRQAAALLCLEPLRHPLRGNKPAH